MLYLQPKYSFFVLKAKQVHKGRFILWADNHLKMGVTAEGLFILMWKD